MHELQCYCLLSLTLSVCIMLGIRALKESGYSQGCQVTRIRRVTHALGV